MKLLDQLCDEIRKRDYSIRTEQAYGKYNTTNSMLFLKKIKGYFLDKTIAM